MTDNQAFTALPLLDLDLNVPEDAMRYKYLHKLRYFLVERWPSLDSSAQTPGGLENLALSTCLNV